MCFLVRRQDGPGITFPEFCRIAFSQGVHQLLMKIVVPGSDRRGHSFFIHLARAIDVISQPIINITAAAAFFYFKLIIEFDFRNQQTSKSSGIVVPAPLFFTNLDRQFRFGHAISARASQRRRVLLGKAGRGRSR